MTSASALISLPLKERMLSDSYSDAMECIVAGLTSRTDPARVAAFERQLKTLSTQGQSDADLAAYTLCSAAMTHGMPWPIRAILSEHSPLKLSRDDRVFLLEGHLRWAPAFPRPGGGMTVSNPSRDPCFRWSVTASALMMSPFPGCPAELASKIQLVAEHLISQGVSWMDPQAMAPFRNGKKSEAQLCLDGFEELRLLCERHQMELSAAPANIKRPSRSV